jgi:hypothetical protein
MTDTFSTEAAKILFTSQDNYFLVFRKFDDREFTKDQAMNELVRYRNEARDQLVSLHEREVGEARIDTQNKLLRIGKTENGVGISSVNMGEVTDGYHTFNELYEHRIALFIALMKALPDLSWYKRTEDKDWIILGISLPTGQVTYHVPRKWEDEYLVNIHRYELNDGPPFDGHTSKDVLERIKNLIVDPCEQDD